MSRSPVIYLIALLITVAACKGPAVPRDPGLLSEDFGTGIKLDQPVGDAVQAALAVPSGVIAECLTPEELNARAPYKDRPQGQDLLYAIHAPLQFKPEQTSTDRVFEIRCYLGPENKSSLTLFGHQLASLDPNGMKELLGTPIEEENGSDGNTHLTFIFMVKGASALAIKVTSSHWLGGQCFAFRIALTESPE